MYCVKISYIIMNIIIITMTFVSSITSIALDLSSWSLDVDQGSITLVVAGSGIEFSQIDCTALTITNGR